MFSKISTLFLRVEFDSGNKNFWWTIKLKSDHTSVDFIIGVQYPAACIKYSKYGRINKNFASHQPDYDQSLIKSTNCCWFVFLDTICHSHYFICIFMKFSMFSLELRSFRRRVQQSTQHQCNEVKKSKILKHNDISLVNHSNSGRESTNNLLYHMTHETFQSSFPRLHIEFTFFPFKNDTRKRFLSH